MHGKTYRFTDGEERKPETLGGQMLRQKEVNYPIQLYLPLQEKKMWGTVLLCILFNKTVCKCDLNVEQALSWKSLLQLTATQAKKRLEEGRKL